MPQRALVPCASGSCPELVRPPEKHCPKCSVRAQTTRSQERRVFDKKRGSAHRRGYGATWRERREYKLGLNPFCEHTFDDGSRCGRKATDVDHVIARARGGSDEMRNLQSLCHAHHSSTTVKYDGGFGRPVRQKT